MHEVAHELRNAMVKKMALIARVKLKAAEIKTLNTNKQVLHRWLEHQNASRGTERKRRRAGDIYQGVGLKHVGMRSEVLVSVTTCSPYEMLDLFLELRRGGDGHAGVEKILAAAPMSPPVRYSLCSPATPLYGPANATVNHLWPIGTF